FLLRLTSGRGERIFAVADLALRDRPRTVVLLRPERTAGMHQQDFDLARSRAKEQQTGTRLGSHRVAYRGLARRCWRHSMTAMVIKPTVSRPRPVPTATRKIT